MSLGAKSNNVFWQFADGLFENQDRLGKSLYQELAKKLGLNMKKFNDCLYSRKCKDEVEADYQEGIKTGVRGTSGSFFNGELISGALPHETLKNAMEKTLVK